MDTLIGKLYYFNAPERMISWAQDAELALMGQVSKETARALISNAPHPYDDDIWSWFETLETDDMEVVVWTIRQLLTRVVDNCTNNHY